MRSLGSVLSAIAVVVVGGALAIAVGQLAHSRRRHQHSPAGFDCGCRVVHGRVPGLVNRWRPGHAHLEEDQLVWQRRPWRWQQARLELATVEPVIQRQRRVLDAILLALLIDLDAVVVPVRLRGGERLELAIMRFELDNALTQLHQLTYP